MLKTIDCFAINTSLTRRVNYIYSKDTCIKKNSHMLAGG